MTKGKNTYERHPLHSPVFSSKPLSLVQLDVLYGAWHPAACARYGLLVMNDGDTSRIPRQQIKQCIEQPGSRQTLVN